MKTQPLLRHVATDHWEEPSGTGRQDDMRAEACCRDVYSFEGNAKCMCVLGGVGEEFPFNILLLLEGMREMGLENEKEREDVSLTHVSLASLVFYGWPQVAAFFLKKIIVLSGIQALV